MRSGGEPGIVLCHKLSFRNPQLREIYVLHIETTYTCFTPAYIRLVYFTHASTGTGSHDLALT